VNAALIGAALAVLTAAPAATATTIARTTFGAELALNGTPGSSVPN
jgi:hypothetical protein